MIQQKLLDEWQRNAPTEEYARAVYYLINEVGLSHSDIFGGQQVVWEDGNLKQVETSGMNVFQFIAYIELMQMDAEERKKEQEKAERQAKMGKSKMPN